MASPPAYQIEYHSTSIDEDDRDAMFKIRRNGKVFHIQISPCTFVNSPAMTEKYLACIEVLRSGKEVMGDIFDTDVYEWIVKPCEPLLVELAPPPPGDPNHTRVSLQQHLFAESFVLHLDIIDEELLARRVLTGKAPFRPSFCRFDESFLDELEEWTHFYDPAGIILSFKDPKDALFQEPGKVLIDNEQTECFYKPCHSRIEAVRELKTYKAIAAAGLYGGQLNLCRVHGVVMDECDFILGILLSYVDCADRPLSARVSPEDADDPPTRVRRKWVGQLDVTLSSLHKAGIVWGDVKAENVLIDQSNNAWITDFGGGYTEGWVDRALADTIEGDAMGMAKIRKLLFPSKTT